MWQNKKWSIPYYKEGWEWEVIHKKQKVRDYSYISVIHPRWESPEEKHERCQHYFDDNYSQGIIKMGMNTTVKRTEVCAS